MRAGKEFECRLKTSEGVAALVGPSGAGKTTVLNMIAGLMTPDQGHIKVGNITLFDHAAEIHLPANRRQCGYVFQDRRLFPHMNVLRNLGYGPNRPDAERFDHFVDLLKLRPLLNRKPDTLSGGEAQRVAFARALLADPSFLLLDEPLTALDSETRETMLSSIETVRDETKLPMIYVSHNLDEVTRLTETIVEIRG